MASFFSNLPNIRNWLPKTRGEAEEIADDAEKAERSIEERMENVNAKLKARGYSTLDQDELKELAEDLTKILEFVEHAVTVLEASTKLKGIDTSLRRLKYVKTRLQTIKSRRDFIAKVAS